MDNSLCITCLYYLDQFKANNICGQMDNIYPFVHTFLTLIFSVSQHYLFTYPLVNN
jgi:hypothetical protein